MNVWPAAPAWPRLSTAMRRLGRPGAPDGLHDAGDLPVQQGQGHFRGRVVGAQAGAAAGDDDGRLLGQQRAEGGSHRLAVGDHQGRERLEAVFGEPVDDDGAGVSS